VQGQTEAAAELFRRAAAGAGDVLTLLKQEPGSLQSPLHPAELHVDALLGHAQMLSATQRCGCHERSGGLDAINRLTTIIARSVKAAASLPPSAMAVAALPLGCSIASYR